MLRITPRHFHFFGTLIVCVFALYFQMYVFSRFSNPWLNIDLVSIVVAYMAIEHFLLGSLLRVGFLATLMQMSTAAPDGFYIMYFLLVLVGANFISRHLVLHNLFSQFLSFAGLFALKFVLLYFVVHANTPDITLLNYLFLVSPGFLVTTLLSVPLFSALSEFDRLFEFASPRDRKQALDLASL